MSEHQKEQLAWVVRILTIVGLGFASVVGMNVWNKTDETYTLIKVYNERINHLESTSFDNKEKFRDILVELKEIRERQFQLQQKINTNQHN